MDDETEAILREDRPDLRPGEIQATADLCVFYVGSYTGAPPHIVNLAEFDLNGECECRGFRIGCRSKLESELYPGTRFRCRHLKRVWAAFGEFVLRKMLENNGQIKRRRTVKTYQIKRP
jgi:hypothetical protein